MITSILKFARVRIIISMYALAFLGSASVGEINFQTLLVFFLVVTSTIHATSINDLSDLRIDKINLKNARDRPLVTKDISYKKFWVVHSASGMLTVLFSFFYGAGAVMLTIVVLIIDYIYSLKPLRVSDRGIASQLLLPLVYVYYPFSLGYWSSNVASAYPWVLSFGLYLAFVARLLLKDFRDVKGDKLHGKMTFLLRNGTRTTCIVSGAFWLLAAAVVTKATSFAPSILFPVVFGLFQVFIFLQALQKTSEINEQQEIVAFIARSANILIITILAFFLCQREIGLSRVEIVTVPAGIGGILLFLNFVQYLHYRKLKYRFSEISNRGLSLLFFPK